MGLIAEFGHAFTLVLVEVDQERQLLFDRANRRHDRVLVGRSESSVDWIDRIHCIDLICTHWFPLVQNRLVIVSVISLPSLDCDSMAPLNAQGMPEGMHVRFL